MCRSLFGNVAFLKMLCAKCSHSERIEILTLTKSFYFKHIWFSWDATHLIYLF